MNDMIRRTKEGRKIISVAVSKKGKYRLQLEKDDYPVANKYYYTVRQYDYDSLRGVSDVGHVKVRAISRFKQEIKDWNYYNTSLGKLYIKKDM